MLDYTRHVDEVKSIQTSVLTGAPDWLEPSTLGHVRCLIRLSVEFSYFLADFDSAGNEDFDYLAGSVFAGTESFQLVAMLVSVMGCETPNPLVGKQVSAKQMKDIFLRAYRELADSESFKNRCQLLLDLFRMQVVFVGLTR
ncbi:MAG: hypothetical protein ABL967_17490 [Bryobacteraceae bacterium]